MKTLFENNMDMEQMDMFTPGNKERLLIVDWLWDEKNERRRYNPSINRFKFENYVDCKLNSNIQTGILVDVNCVKREYTISIYLVETDNKDYNDSGDLISYCSNYGLSKNPNVLQLHQVDYVHIKNEMGYYEISIPDKLQKEIIAYIKRQVDYILNKWGNNENFI